MQKQKHPSGQNQGYRYNGNNGTEGGGAGAYQPQQIRICPTGAQGGQQQDPKQQPQSIQGVYVTGGGMPQVYSPGPRTNQYFRGGPSHQRMVQPRAVPVGSNIAYMQPGQAIYNPLMAGGVPPMAMTIPQLNFPTTMSQQPARHQGHGTGGGNTGPTSNAYLQQNYYLPSHLAAANYSYPQLFLSRQTSGPNSAQYPVQQPQPTQQPQMVSNAPGQGMVALSLQQQAGPTMQLPPPHNFHPPMKDKKNKTKRKNALSIINPDSGEDILEEFYQNEVASPSAESSASHTPQPQQSQEASDMAANKAAVAAEFAVKVLAVATEQIPLPTAPPQMEEVAANGPTSRATSPPVVIQPPPSSHVIPHVEPMIPKMAHEQVIPTVSAKTNSPSVELHRPQTGMPKSAPSISSHLVQHNPPPTIGSVCPPPSSLQMQQHHHQQQQQHQQQLQQQQQLQHQQQLHQQQLQQQQLQHQQQQQQQHQQQQQQQHHHHQQQQQQQQQQHHHQLHQATVQQTQPQQPKTPPLSQPLHQQQPPQQPQPPPPQPQQPSLNTTQQQGATRTNNSSPSRKPAQAPPQVHPNETVNKAKSKKDEKVAGASKRESLRPVRTASPPVLAPAAQTTPPIREQREQQMNPTPTPTIPVQQVHQPPRTASPAAPTKREPSPPPQIPIRSTIKPTPQSSLSASAKTFEDTINFIPTTTITGLPPSQPAQTQPPSMVVTVDDKETNGETDSSSDTMGKAQQRPKTNKQQKKKDLNRKGVEKEGTDMDAFVEPAPGTESQLPPQPSTTPPPPQQQQPPPVSQPTPTPTPPPLSAGDVVRQEEKITPVETIPAIEDEIENEVTPNEVENTTSEVDAMVATKNEENAKANLAVVNNNNNNSVNNNNNNNNATQENIDVEDNGVIESMTIERSAPTLQYNYKEDQWSPLNLSGKKVYDRNFLYEVNKTNPICRTKPENLTDCDLFRDKPNDVSNNNRRPHGSSSMNITRGDNNIPYLRSSSSQRGGMMGGKNMRSSMQGSRGMGGNMSHSGSNRLSKTGSSYGSMNSYGRDEPNLHRDPNSWKPTRLVNTANVPEDELKTESILKNMRSILNKLTPQKFDALFEKIIQLDIDNEDRLKKVVKLVFEKAVDEPSFSTMYAQLCHKLQGKMVPLNKEGVPKEEGAPAQPPSKQDAIIFRKVLINKCQEQFEKTKEDQNELTTKTKEILDTKDPEKQKELKLLFDEEERKIRVKAVGLVRFIGELYKFNMLTPNIMHECISVLLARIDEEPLECLCKLLTTVGKELEKKSSEQEFNEYFAIMNKLAQKSSDSKVSSRIRFMLQDVIELRMNKWVPRRDENKPKTIEQIHKDAERETLMETAMYTAPSMMPGGGSNRGKHMGDDRRRNQRNQGGEDGWLSVGNKSVRNYIVEPSKFLNLRGNSEVEGLGSGSQFGQWATGANAKRSENKSFNNKFALLGQHDDKKSSSSFSSMNRKGTAPSPSLEKERMLSAVKQLANNDLQRRGGPGSGPSSRESSRQRYGASPATSLSSSSTMSRDDDRPRDLRESTSLKDSSKDHLNNQPKEELMSEEKLQRQTRLVTQEWISDKNVEETCRTIEETFIGANLIQFVHTGLSDVLENSKSDARTLFGELLVILIKDKKLVQTKDVIEGFSKLIVLAEDLIIDVPKIWQYFANLIVPLLTHEVFNFADVKAAAKQTSKENLSVLLVEIIKLLIKEKGPSWIKTQWETSQVQIKDFVPDNVEVGSFIKNHKLGFISGNCEVQSQPDDTLTSSEIEERLYSFLKSDSNKACDHACDWIKVNISEKVTGSNDFIKAVTRAVFRASIITDKEKLSMQQKLSMQHFQHHKNLIKKFVDNDEKRELACLYAVQNLLVIELEVQLGLIVEIFEALYNLGVISHDGFLKWKSDETTIESEGKGVLLKVLPSFFVMLSEREDTEEES